MSARQIGSFEWYGVLDPKERKKIQDRLAQRARRKRLALLKNQRENSVQHSSPNEDSQKFIRTSSYSSTGAESYDTKATTPIPELARDDALLSDMTPSVFKALFNNGSMLGLTCGCVIPIKSNICDPHVPESLQPTALQITTLHQSWIDRFPFPRMRDNMIGLNRIFEEEDFLRDLFNMQSFYVKPELPGWDPSAWVIGKEFSKKWGFLFH